LGRVVPDYTGEEIREIIYKSYRIFYRINDDEQVVYIARFWHAARGEPEIPKDGEG
jgi:plasmid stabilization system protein ParE